MGEVECRGEKARANALVNRAGERASKSGERGVVAIDREDRADMHTWGFVAGGFGALESDVGERGTEASRRRGGMFFGVGGNGGESRAGAFWDGGGYIYSKLDGPGEVREEKSD